MSLSLPPAGRSLQEWLTPEGTCFGCGPANERGLRIRSFAERPTAESALVCDWTPAGHHNAFPGVLNGGIIGALLDCHGNWTALHHLLRRDDPDEAPCTVTYDFHVKMKRPTPVGGALHLVAVPTGSDGDWVTVEARLEAAGEVTATCRGRFVRVGSDHPAHPEYPRRT